MPDSCVNRIRTWRISRVWVFKPKRINECWGGHGVALRATAMHFSHCHYYHQYSLSPPPPTHPLSPPSSPTSLLAGLMGVACHRGRGACLCHPTVLSWHSGGLQLLSVSSAGSQAAGMGRCPPHLAPPASGPPALGAALRPQQVPAAAGHP